MRDWLGRVGRAYLLLILGFGLGFAVSRSRVFPYQVLDTLWVVLGPDRTTGISFVQKLSNDFGLRPTRFLGTYRPKDDVERIPVSGFPLSDRRGPLLMRTSPAGEALDDFEYIFVVGAFDFIGGLHGAVLLTRSGRAVHSWVMTQEGLDWAVRPDQLILPHGVEILPDGSLILAFDDGQSLQRIDHCGRRIWAREGRFHHSVTLEDSTVWVWEDQTLVKVDVESGAVLMQFHLGEISEANPGLDLFGVRQEDFAGRSAWASDPFHPNDIDPLPPGLSARFPAFEAGDLLVSLRSLNLVFVVSPLDLRVKWWRASGWRRQHDPDWAHDGRIVIYDNNMHRGASRIVSIDPETMVIETLLNGEDVDFYSAIRGRQELRSSGAMALVIPDQGRAIALDPDGEISFELINQFDPQLGENLVLTDVRILPSDFLDPTSWELCR